MISVDTNVIVRLLTGDDQPQFKRAKSLFEKESIFISTTVILETEWVLRYAYHFKPLKIADAFQSLFGLSNVQLEEPLIIAEAMEWHKEDLDFADALHLAKSQASRSFATFDKKLIKKALKLTSIPVSEP
jgi:predicted nucleic-acid-binding protein